ncbi:MAG: disulfide bond formation protein B [Candidatus Nealsonbacteria bacterium]|nr:disulfide bond formation protein B [Candidatus Nealsonbacteria bacterium]
MSPLASAANQILSILTITAQILIVGLFAIILFKKSKLLDFIQKYAILFSFIVALIAVSGSLFYSEVAGFTPCKLCWFQRIFMYPQVILLGLALLKKDRNIADYILALSIPGAIIAFYHYLLQLGIVPELSCQVVGYSVSCAQRFVMNFGYITIPMMAISAFILIILLQLIKRGYNKNTV